MFMYMNHNHTISIEIDSSINICTIKVELNGRYFVQVIFLSYHLCYVMLDDTNKLCDKNNNGGCDIESTTCQQSNGTTHCDCKTGYYKKDADAKHSCYGKFNVGFKAFVCVIW